MHKSETCPACHQRIKKAKQRSKVDADGIQRLPDGREICRTKKAWRARVDELFARDLIRRGVDAFDYWLCANCGAKSGDSSDFDPDHKVKRSLKRDDRLSNLQLLGNANLCNCHLGVKHNGFRLKKRLQK